MTRAMSWVVYDRLPAGLWSVDHGRRPRYEVQPSGPREGVGAERYAVAAGPFQSQVEADAEQARLEGAWAVMRA